MSLNDLLNDLGLQPKCHLLSAYQLIISVFEKLHVKIVMCSIHKENCIYFFPDYKTHFSAICWPT